MSQPSAQRNLGKQAVETFRKAFAGSVVTPQEAAYDESRALWNAMIDRRPAAIAQCKSADDVVRALAFARAEKLEVTVRGAGHNIAGNAVCDGGLMVDLARMRAVRVDKAARRAHVQAGARLADVDSATQEHGLATPVGINSTTGIAGLTLGGGFGWLTRLYGMTVDNLVSAQVVTVSGQKVTASKSENADLFWGLRGGGGNFGIVTEFEFELHAVRDVLAGLLVFPFAQAKNVLARYREFAATAPPELTAWIILRQAPPVPFLPERVHGQNVVVMPVFFLGEPARGEKLIAGLRGIATPLGEHIGVQPYAAWQQAFDPLLTPGARNYWKSHNFTELGDGAIASMIDYAGKLPTPQCEIFVAHVTGAANRVASNAMAYGARDTNFIMNVHSRWEKPAEDEKCIAWARAFFEASKPFASSGAYVNFMTGDEGDRVAAAYGENYGRLVQLKRKYDPENVLHWNQNVKP